MSIFRRRAPQGGRATGTGFGAGVAAPLSRWDGVTAALTGGDLDAAAAMLVEWHASLVTDDVDVDHEHRTDCRQFVDRAIAFLESARGPVHIRSDELFEDTARVVYEARDMMNPVHTSGLTRLVRRRQGLPVPGPGGPNIPTDDVGFLSRYGRYQFLGWEAAGEPGPIDDWYERLTPWFQPLMAGPPARSATVARLNGLATAHGGWVAIGAWKVLLDFSADFVDEGRDALVACLRAYRELGVTNLAFYIPPVELAVWRQIFDDSLPNDGFFRPPVFSTPHGPQKADYLRAAAVAAASRYPERLDHVPGIVPVLPTSPAVQRQLGYSLGAFGQLLLLGAHAVQEESRHEPAILARARRWAQGTDHVLVLEQLVGIVEPDPDPAWIAVGAARFCEEYLDGSLTGSAGHRALLDTGLDFLLREALLRTSIDPACLSPAEAERLRDRSAGT